MNKILQSSEKFAQCSTNLEGKFSNQAILLPVGCQERAQGDLFRQTSFSSPIRAQAGRIYLPFVSMVVVLAVAPSYCLPLDVVPRIFSVANHSSIKENH